MTKFMSRDKFRETCLERDNNQCVFCGSKNFLSVHHILERRLFTEQYEMGGYHPFNGATVCNFHHIQCEATNISVERVREACGITRKIIPSHLYDDHIYDKWGNIILPNGQRMIGELFFDDSVQKILKEHDKLHLFTNYVKYPRTHHVTWSEGMHDDDRMHSDMSYFYGKKVVVTTKLDGENTSMYNNYIHARSIDSPSNFTRDWVKGFHASISQDIPEGWRICGENMYAEHSISYKDLDTYFYGFSIWNEKNVCLSWDETLEWFQLLGITPVPVLYYGSYNESLIKSLWSKDKWSTMEGYVIRLADEIPYGQFKKSFGKFVRKGHVNTIKHWLFGGNVNKNELKANI